MSVLEINVTSGRAAQDLVNIFQASSDPHTIANKVARYITSVHTGTEGSAPNSPPSIRIQVQDSKGLASGTITFTGVGAASDTVLINGVTFTAVASGATGNQWNVGGSVAASAANLAAAINASVTALVSGYVTASSLAGVLMVTSAFYGLAGNAITIAEGVDSTSAMVVSGPRLTGGTTDASSLTLNF